MASTVFTSCSDQFLQDKKNYDSASADSYNYFSGALGRVADIYAWCLPDVRSNPSWKYNSTLIFSLNQRKNIVALALL